MMRMPQDADNREDEVEIMPWNLYICSSASGIFIPSRQME